jgi:hypothetical protein
MLRIGEMMIVPHGPEAFLPPLLQDKIKNSLDRKEPLKIEKNVFKTPDNPKCPSASFSINMVFAKLKFKAKKPLEATKIPLERDGFSKEAAEEIDEDDEEGEES